MSNLIVMKGLPCSGKTTWATQWVQKKHKRIRISWTELRSSIGGSAGDREKTLFAVDASVRMMTKALNAGYDVVLDECNLYALSFSLFIGQAQKHRHHVEFHTMKTKLDVCKQRLQQRGATTAELMRCQLLAEKYEGWLNR